MDDPDFPIEERYINEWVTVLERYNYDQVLVYLKKLEQIEVMLLDFFWLRIYDQTLFNRIQERKIRLAKILARRAGVLALPEDRTRIVLTLARCADLDLAYINKEFAVEFGPHFKVYETYSSAKATKTWKDLATKAKEIRNALHNYNCLMVHQEADELTGFYRLFSVADPKRLWRIIELGREILSTTTRADFITFTPQTSTLLKTKIKEFYKLADRAVVDVENLEPDSNLEAINNFIAKIVYVADIRGYLIANNLPINSYERVRKELRESLAREYFINYLGTDEFKRVGVKLEPITKTN